MIKNMIFWTGIWRYKYEYKYDRTKNKNKIYIFMDTKAIKVCKQMHICTII